MDEPGPAGKRLITGPTGSGKTWRTARLLKRWLEENGPEGVLVLEFAPEHERPDGRILGRRLERFMQIPDDVLHMAVETKAPRAGSPDPGQAVETARENGKACAQVWEGLPEQLIALFVNDATMPFHVPGSDPVPLLGLIDRAPTVVVNALDPEGFEEDHPITKQERDVLEKIGAHVERVERLARPVGPVQEGPSR